MRYFLFLLLWIAGHSVMGQEELFSDLQQKVLKELGIHPDSVSAPLSAEKELPGTPGYVALVFPELSMGYEDTPYGITGHIVVTDETGKIIDHLVETTSEWYTDAMELDRITLDTAPYLIASGKRAFGVRLRHYGHSRANPYTYETLSLYVVEKNALRRVLTDFQTSLYRGDWDTNCTGEFKGEESVLIIGNTKNEGYNDLIIKTRVMYTVMFVTEQGECDETSSELSYQTALHYLEGAYVYSHVKY